MTLPKEGGILNKALDTCSFRRPAQIVLGVTLLVMGSLGYGAAMPNFLLIVVDDLGFTDLGAFGGEIRTPNLDALALGGVRLTNFHAGVSCAPSRAMLMTGTDNHLAGVGSQGSLRSERQALSPYYQNALRAELPTLAELLAAQGYHNVAVAKWHLGDGDALPNRRGFDRSLVLMQGGASHFDDTPMFESYGKADWREDGAPYQLPDRFYSTDLMTAKLIDYLEKRPADGPFFAYLGYTAPHWPLQAPPDSIERYADQYQKGWDSLRQSRLAGAQDAGVIPETAVQVDDEPGYRLWSSLDSEEKGRQAKRMQVYAAMVDRVDENIGQLMRYLSENGLRENTLIVFLSDNGVEGHDMERYGSNVTWVPATFDNSLPAIGTERSYVALGASWARAINAPFRGSKARLSEGGIRVPAFANLQGLESGVDNAYLRIMDVAPTFLEFAGAEIPAAMRGRSFAALLKGGAPPYGDSDIVAAETFGRRMAQRGNWKILRQELPLGNGDWQLYNLEEDLGEQHDLSDAHPQIRAELIAAWEIYAEEVGVILPETPVHY